MPTANDILVSRYNHSYPNIVAGMLLGEDKKDKFQFRSCSGAVTQEIIVHQVDTVAVDQDMIMFSAGKLKKPATR
jgi:hypothetical protein